ncbi:ABC transporter substrate-binding protein (plasmid) [Embleya sp. NBC_00888]|uniref:ABC transporter substrate-binding protein n=1 Tax=Embleya sp. NBC_00888 TaxID=2975960 RepID=UPI002F91AE2E|nr:ABC transporter substrate-binding protein [Embleya sp. NBC_00888]
MRPRRLVTPLAVAVALVVSGCGGTESASESGGGKKENVTYLTSFGTFGREAYAYVALEKGYFDEAGFDVTIAVGSGTVDDMKMVAGGRADYSVGDFTTYAITSAKERFPLTVVGAIHQRSLAGIMALEGSGIGKPGDLVGKKIADQPGSTNQVMFPVYAKAAGIPADKVEFVPSAPAALPQLLVSGQVDGIGQFAVGKPLIEKATKGKKVVVLRYGDLLPDLYSNTLFTRKDIADKHPDQVKKFSAALLKGLADAVADPEAAARTLKKYNPTQDVEVAAAELRLMADYVKPPGFTEPLGSMDRNRVSTIVRILEDSTAIKKDAFGINDYVSFDLLPRGSAS